MAGLVGVFRWAAQGEADRAFLVRQMELLSDRGPDDGALYLEGPFGLGHRRLDAEGTGHQPHWDDESRIAVMIDADLLNAADLALQLEARGHRLASTEPTEVVLAGYREWGDRVLEKLEGRFALAVFDRTARSFLLARDPMGTKPLYYHADRRRFLFASELRALMVDPSTPRVLDPGSVAQWFSGGWVQAPDTLVQDVHQLRPGEALLVTETGMKRRRFWSAGQLASAPELGLGPLRETLTKETSRLAEGASTLALSGGRVSTSIMVWLRDARKSLRAVSLINYDPVDRRHARRYTSEYGFEHREHRPEGGPTGILRDAIASMDSPLPCPSYPLQFTLGTALRGYHSVEPPVLCGYGAAELTLERNLPNFRSPLRPELERLRSQALPSSDLLSMAGGELDRLSVVSQRCVRSPLLQASVVGQALGWRERDVILDWSRLSRGSAPSEVSRKEHRRARLPLGAWLRSRAQSWAEDVLFGGGGSGMLERRTLRRWWYAHQLRISNRSDDLWRAIVFEAWLQRLLAS